MNKSGQNQILDLKGVPCPMNFVKVKLKLETMDSGEKLEIVLDDGEPVKNVSVSLKDEGHRMLKVERSGECWKVLVEKK